MWFTIILLVVGAYLIGSIPTAVLIGKLYKGVDVREHGSGNAGATNTIRVLGPVMGFIVLIFDVFKGWFAVMTCPFFATALISGGQMVNVQVGLAVAAILGHVFPVFAGFRGGKGVATSIGIALALYFYPMLVVLGVFLLIFFTIRYVSIGSIIAAILFPFVVIFIFNMHEPALMAFAIAIAVFVPVTHRKNIMRLIKGEENRFSFLRKGQG